MTFSRVTASFIGAASILLLAVVASPSEKRQYRPYRPYRPYSSQVSTYTTTITGTDAPTPSVVTVTVTDGAGPTPGPGGTNGFGPGTGTGPGNTGNPNDPNGFFDNIGNNNDNGRPPFIPRPPTNGGGNNNPNPNPNPTPQTCSSGTLECCDGSGSLVDVRVDPYTEWIITDYPSSFHPSSV